MRRAVCSVGAFLFATALVSAPFARLAAQEPPRVAGVITDAGTPAEYQVQGIDVLCTPETKTKLMRGFGGELVQPCPVQVFGRSATVFGKREKRTKAVLASEVDVQLPDLGRVGGYAVIDRLLTDDVPGERMVRADGYAIRLTGKTRITFAAPLQGLAEIATNQWVRYGGKQLGDGSVLADTAVFEANETKTLEARMAGKAEFDPAAVTDDEKQGHWSKSVRGLDAKRVPAWQDAAMQARVNALAARLMPAYEKALPDKSPGKFVFRFQVVDLPKIPDAITLPSGIILIPHQVVERLENDDQLATVLADNIATALEKQAVRGVPQDEMLRGAKVSGAVAGALVPGAGLAA